MEKSIGKRGVRNKEGTSNNPRSCRPQATTREPAYYAPWHHEKFMWPSNPMPDACASDYPIEKRPVQGAC